MTSQAQISIGSHGAPGASRLVSVVRSGPVATEDPSPTVTIKRDVRILAVGMRRLTINDPEAYGGETPDEQHTRALVTLLEREGARRESPIGLVGYGEAGWRAVGAAALLGDAVDRLALVAVPRIDEPLDHGDAVDTLRHITADTLVLAGRGQGDVSEDDARWIAHACARPTVEIVDTPTILSLAQVWDRVLDHTAPDAGRR